MPRAVGRALNDQSADPAFKALLLSSSVGDWTWPW